MIKLDANYLKGLGLGSLSKDEANVLLRHIYETLEVRVGTVLANEMSDAQLLEFEEYFQAQDDASAMRFLEQNFPHYREIVQEEYELLTDEVQRSVPTILALIGDPA